MDVREKTASKKQLIDREALLSFEKMDAELCATCGEHHTAEDVIMMIKTAPTLDAVSVVRCRECKFRSSWMMNRNLRYICPESGMFPNGENDFCSYGDRKEGAD